MFNKSQSNTILIAAGGTGGHIFPALEVAKKLISYGYNVQWAGTKDGLESDIIPKNDIPINYLNISGIRGKGISKLIFTPIKLIVSLFQALSILLKHKPKVVLGMGGYVTGPIGIAAFLLRKKLIIHEQNSVVGTTNQILSNFANKVLYAFPDAFNEVKADKFVLTGNPVREKFKELLSPEKRFRRRTNPLKVLVLGGSRGAKVLNECIVETLTKWQTNTNSVLPQIWHQTGAKLFKETEELYKKNNLTRIKLEPFIEDMPAAYAWADLVIARAGALTVSELTAAGVGSILVPFPYAIDDHQTTNAKYLESNDAAIIIPQNSLNSQKLLDIMQSFVTHRDKLLIMAKNAHDLSSSEALDKVVDYCR